VMRYGIILIRARESKRGFEKACIAKLKLGISRELST
jgi:hypothetical protein